jgi:hypothetical protein
MCQRYGNADGGKSRRQSASLLRRSEISDVVRPIGARGLSSETDMTRMIASGARVGFVILAGANLTAGN